MKIAKFKHILWDTSLIDDESREKDLDYIRLTKYTDVEFTDVDEKEQNSDMQRRIDEKIIEITKLRAADVKALEEKKEKFGV